MVFQTVVVMAAKKRETCATFTDNKATLFTALQIDLLGIITKTWD